MLERLRSLRRADATRVVRIGPRVEHGGVARVGSFMGTRGVICAVILAVAADAGAQCEVEVAGLLACGDGPAPDRGELDRRYEARFSMPASRSAPTGRRARSSHNEGERFARRSLDAEEAALAEGYARSHCAQPDARAVFRRARILYEANRFAEAAALFSVVARDHPESGVGELAANLWLDSLNARGCEAAMADAVEPLRGIYCVDGEESELCEVLARMSCAIGRRDAEALEREERFREAGEVYLQLAGRCEPGDVLLYNAAVELDIAGDARAPELWDRLVQEYPTSALAARAMWRAAEAQERVLRIREAAEAWEEIAERFPGAVGGCPESASCVDAGTARIRALDLWLALGEREAALRWLPEVLGPPGLVREEVLATGRTVRRSVTTYLDAEEHAERALAIAELFDTDRQRARFLATQLREREPPPHLRLRMEVALGRTYVAMGRPAREILERALRREPAAARAGGQRTRDAVGEARFLVAMDAVREARAIRLRPFRGRDAEALTRWASDTLRTWVERRGAATVRAEQELARIAEAGSSRWIVAAAEVSGRLRLEMAEPLVPPEDPALREAWEEAVGADAARWRSTGRDRLEFCLITAVVHRLPTEAARRCGETLTTIDPQRFPPFVELLPRD